MTATDELRRMLDERGVEWEGQEDVHTDFTFWCGVHACETGPEPSLAVYHLTPAQAIAATLGSSNCTNGERTNGTCREVMIDRFFRGCGECGYMWEYMYGIGRCQRPNFCPNCGRKVVSNG